jgi:hypothetical protein
MFETETHRLLHEILHELKEIRRELHHKTAVTGGIMYQQGNPMALLPIAPGNSPQFAVTPTPTGVTTLAANTVWSSSDTTNAPVTANASDATGLTATVNIPSTAVVGTTFTLTWTYTNADGTVATPATLSLTIVALVTDVTGGTMAQVV